MKNFKLGYFDDIKNKNLLELVDDGKPHNVKLTTVKIDKEFDKRDYRFISRLKDVKIV